MMEKNKNSFDFKKLLNSRSLKYGSNSFIMVAAVIAIAVILNMLLSPAFLQKTLGKDAIKLDLTSNKLYSIGDKTDEILKGITKEIKIYALFDDAKIKSDAQLKEIDEVLKQYTKYTNVKLEHVDLDKNPGFINSIDPEGIRSIQKDDVIFQSGKKIKKLSSYEFFTTELDPQTFQPYATGSSAEQSITGAIKYVTSDKTPAVYFLDGHGENKADADYRTVAQYLQRNNYEIKTLNLATEAKVPSDAEIIIVTAPKKDITSDEKEKLSEYLKNGGNALFAFDPLTNNTKLTQFEDILKGYNLSLNYDVVKESDEKRHIKNKPNDILPDVQDNSINSPINPKSLYMIMPKAGSINILKNQNQNIKITSLIKTSAKAVGEPIDVTKGKNLQGPLDLAVAVQNEDVAKASKIVVIGNGSFMTDNSINQYEQYSVNGLYFFLNSLNWLQDKKEEVIIAPKAYNTPRLQLSALTSNLLALFAVIILPLLILGFGTFVWMRRRHL